MTNRTRTTRPKPDPIGVHFAHCYQGENEGICKYSDDNCPAKPTIPSNPRSLEELEQRVIAQIEGQNWSDEPLSDQDKHLIGMAVSATAHLLGEPIT